MLRLPHNPPDPRTRYHAVQRQSRSADTPYEHALHHLLHSVPLSPEAADVLRDVTAAYGSFSVPGVRHLFEACLLGQATDEELTQHFGVSAGEAAAYRHLFFDMAVFPNTFHVIAYIASVVDPVERELLREGHTRGFRTLAFKYAPARASLDPEEAIQRIFESDARLYMQYKDVVPTSKAAKEVRALGKQVVTTAQALGKIAPPKKVEEDGLATFVIESGPGNPTLDDLLAKGVEVIR